MALQAPDAAAATWHYVKCPLWNGGSGVLGWPSPEAFATYLLNNSRDFSQYDKPIRVTTCSPNPHAYYSYSCDAVTATGRPTGAGAVGFGPGLTRGAGANPEDGWSYCAYTSDVDQKNDPPPPCPNCGSSKGDPVNIATGTNYQSEVDFRTPNAGGLDFIRYYKTPVHSSTAVGAGWSHNWSASLFAVGLTEIDATRGNGSVLKFTQSGSQWLGDPDFPERLVALPSGWQLTDGNNNVETYDSAGRLISVQSAAGTSTILEYTDGTVTGPHGAVADDNPAMPIGAGALLRVTDFRGRSLQFYYDSRGNLSRMVDPTGGTYRYTHALSGFGSGNLLSVQYPDGNTRSYVYNESANTSGASLYYALTGIVDENNARFATLKYFSDGRALSTEHAGGVEKYQFTYTSTSSSYTDPLGTPHTSPISTIVNFKQVTGTTRTCTGCGGTSTESYTFDANRNLSSHKDFNGNLTCYTFGSRNLEIARTEGLSGSGTCAAQVTTGATRTISTNWQSTWRLPVQRAEPLRITTWSYNGDAGVSCAPAGASTALVCSRTVQATLDADGSQAFSATLDGAPRTWSNTYDANGQVLSVDGPRTDVSDVTTYGYFASDDPAGNYRAGDLQSITDAKGHVTQLVQYDGAGRLVKSIDPNGLETILEYWPRGWLKSRKVGSVPSGYETTAYDYDAVGQLTKVTLPDASFVSYNYDPAHRLTDIQDGLANHTHYTLDAMGNRTQEDTYDPSNALARTRSRVIDGLNRVAREIGGVNPASEKTQYGYDANGNRTSITDPLNRTTTQQYDAVNRLIAVIDPFNGVSHPTTFGYDGRDALTQVTDPTGLSTTYAVDGQGDTRSQSSPDTGSTSFTYDAASNLQTKLDARGIQATYGYDELNRITQIAYPDQTVGYTYDSCANGIGRLCAISDRSGTTAYSYDLWGRVTSKTQTVDSLAQTISYGYNGSGQLATITLPSGHVLTYGYANNRPVSVAVDGLTILDSAVYRPFGPLESWTWGNSAAGTSNDFTRAIDADYRITGVRSDLPASGTQPLFDRQFSWDDQGRVMAITDLANSSLSASYGYDALDRVTSASQSSSSWAYSYDGTGDRLTSTDGAGAASYAFYPGSHRLQSIAGARSKSYLYDGAGNQTSDGTTTWTYGGDNRPTQAGSAVFVFNALGQRVEKVAASTTRFVFDEAGHLAGEYADDGSLIEETVWLGDLPVATLRPNGAGVDAYYVHTDHLGTPRMVTRPSDNQVVWRWDNTEPFGSSSPDDNPSGLGTFVYNLRFPGQYYDAETGTNYNYFRDYDPSIGRYIESDPVGIIPAGRRNLRRAGIFDPNLNHLYGYVVGNPLSFADPLGLTATSPSAWDIVKGAARGGARGRWGGALGLALGIGIGAMSEMCKPTPQERCEAQCTEDNKRAAKFCHAMAITKGGKKGTPAYSAEYSKCMDEQDDIYIQCIQDCKKEQ